MAFTALQVLNKVVENSVVDNRLHAAWTLLDFYNAGRMRTVTKTQMPWDVIVDGSNVGITTIDGDPVDNTQDNTIQSNVTIGAYRIYHRFTIPRVAIQEARTLAPSDLKDLFQVTIQGGILKLLRTFNGLLWTGDGTAGSAGVIGFQKILNQTYAYGGIDPTVYPRWNSLVFPNPTTPGTARNIDRLTMLKFDQAVRDQETWYNYVTSSTNINTSYANVWDSIAGSAALTYDIGEGGGLDTEMGKQTFKNMDLGHGTRSYNGLPLKSDPMCPDGALWFLNLQDVEVCTMDLNVDPRANQTIQTGSDTYSQIVSSKVMGLNINMAEIPSTVPTQRRFEMFFVPQLRLRNRISMQVITDLK